MKANKANIEIAADAITIAKRLRAEHEAKGNRP